LTEYATDITAIAFTIHSKHAIVDVNVIAAVAGLIAACPRTDVNIIAAAGLTDAGEIA
jgi:hypothetical protein